MKPIRVIELFAGVGGFRLGFENVNKKTKSEAFKIVWSNQWEPGKKKQAASNIYESRFGSEGHSNQDISTVPIESIPAFDMLVGGFPCQDYSVAKTLNQAHGLEGKKGVLWWEIYRIIQESKKPPKYLLLENVDRLVKSPASQRGRDFAIMLASLADLGYAVEWRVINAADYGMPQRRRRVFILGYHHSTSEYKRLKRIKNLSEWLTSEGTFASAFPVHDENPKGLFADTAETLEGDLVEITKKFNSDGGPTPFENAGVMFGREYLTFKVTPKYSGKRKTLGDILVKKGTEIPEEFLINKKDLPKWKQQKGAKKILRHHKETGTPYYYSEGGMVFPDALEAPSRTIVTGEGGSTPSRFKHVVEDHDGRLRRLLPEELERLNMFPTGHTRGASDIERAFFMGNALVVGIVERIGTTLIENHYGRDSRPAISPPDMAKERFDSSDPHSIESYARRLLNKSLRLYLSEAGEISVRKGKGKLGQYLEEHFFGYEPNSTAGPDFPDAGVELKTSPMKRTAKGLVAKERLVLNTIDYMEEHKRTFHTSSFFRKNSLLLLMFFLHQHDVDELDYIFRIIRLWKFPEVDLQIIKDDWEKIVAMIRDGKAHEISEGDTMYLAASTKGANSKSLRKQPFNPNMAMQRAFSLKPRYLNYIISQSLESGEFADSVPVIRDKRELERRTFEDVVESRFSPYIGKTEDEISRKVGAPLTNAKHSAYVLCRYILGVKGQKIEEFEKADLSLKTVVLEQNGNLKESMSFKQMQFEEIAEQEWEDSGLFEELSKRFLFVVFQKDGEGRRVLRAIKFWGMPNSDLEKAKAVWLDTRKKIRVGEFNSFIKSSDNHVVHVRPKARNKDDVAQTKWGPVEKKCFWLNRGYVLGVLFREFE